MNTELQAKAKKLFLQSDLSKTEIALALDIPRRTLHHWIHQHDWDLEKEALALIPGQVINNCLHIMLRLTDQLLSPDRADAPITPREADTLYKLTMTMSKLKKSPKPGANAAPLVDDDLEERLDREDRKAWEASMVEENKTSAYQASIPEMREASGFRSPSERVNGGCGVGQPTYEEFITGLRAQDERLRHLFPPTPSTRARVAA